MLKCICRSALAAALFLAAAVGAAAQPLPKDIVKGEVLYGWTTEMGTRMAGLRLRLAPGWKTYWRSPGASGIPPSFDWSGSENLKTAEVHFPRPKVFDLGGLRTLGYQREVVWPIEVTPKRPDEPVALRGALRLGVCEEVCVPTKLGFSATLPAKEEGGDSAAISTALALQPTPAEKAGVGRVQCNVEPISDGLRLTAMIEMPRLGPDEIVVVEPADPAVWSSEPEVTRAGGTLRATADLVPPEAGGFALDRSGLRLTVLGKVSAVEITGCSGVG